MLWPPVYKIRHSKRAKHVSLRVYAGSGLEVIIPEKKKKYDVIGFIDSHREWIEKQIEKFKISFVSEDYSVLPNKIELPAIMQSMNIIYHPIESAQSISYRVERDNIIFYGAITDFSVCAPIVIKWLKNQAKLHLKKMLDELSIECELPYQQLSIRAQKTVWGSCTSKKSIQLNYKIIFLPKSTARYILIHELCHTKHLNHSASFWRMVATFVPDFRQHVTYLKTADQWIPRWLI